MPSMWQLRKSYFLPPRVNNNAIGRVSPRGLSVRKKKKKGEQPLKKRDTEKFFFFPPPLPPIEKRFFLLLPPSLSNERGEVSTRILGGAHVCTFVEKVWPFLPGCRGESKQRLPRTDGPIEPIGKICIYGGWIEEKIRKFHRRFSWFWIILHPDSLLGWIDGRFQRDGKKGPLLLYAGNSGI